MTRRVRVLLCAAFLTSLGGSAAAQTPDPEVADEPQLEPFEVPVELTKTEVADPQTVEPALRRAFEAPKGFCKNADHELSSSEAALCELAPAAKLRCPGFALACEKRAAAEKERLRRSASSGTGSDGSSSGTSRGKGRRRHGSGRERQLGEAPPDEQGSSVELPSSSPFGEFLGRIITIIVWTLIALGVGAMLFAGLRALFGRRRDKTDTGPESKRPAEVERAPRPFPTGSPEDLLQRARELALSGELRAATALVLRALLRHLEIGGVLDLHPSRTNGDYVRSLRRKGHRADDLRSVAAEVDAIEFGGGRMSPEEFSSLHTRVSKLVRVASVTLVCLSLFAVGGCRKRPPPDEAPDNAMSSCGTSATGYSALCETLTGRGVKVRRRFTSVEQVASDVTRVVVLEDEIDDTERTMLLHWASMGGTLVVFDPSSAYTGLVSKPEPPCGDELHLEPGFFNVRADAKQSFRLPGASSFDEQGALRLAARCGPRPFIVEATRGAGTVVAIADFRLPMNASFAIEQNAALVTTLVGPPGSTVELVGGWTGTGTDLPLESVTRSGLLPWFLHVLLLGFAIALYRGSPFGTRREPAVVTRRAFAEHAIALGDAYSRVRASRIALVNFGSYALERLRVRLQATKHGRLTDLAGAVAARHGVSESEVMSLVVAVRSAEDQEHDSATETEHLAALRRLAALVKTTGGTS